MSVATPTCLSFPFSWDSLFHPLTFNLCVPFALKWVSCRQNIVGSCFLIQSATLSFLKLFFIGVLFYSLVLASAMQQSESVTCTQMKVCCYEPWTTPGFVASGGEEFNPGPVTRLDQSFCVIVLSKYKREGCHFLLQCMKVKRESEVAQSCPLIKIFIINDLWVPWSWNDFLMVSESHPLEHCTPSKFGWWKKWSV